MKADILERILTHKKKEVNQRKARVPIAELEGKSHFHRETYSLRKTLVSPHSSGVIAEFKRRSPSAGSININADPAQTTRGYFEAGASGISVLTDEQFFGGSDLDLIGAREVCPGPILRKDFVIDAYQVFEAKALGADAILLIAAALDLNQQKSLVQVAHQLGLEVLLEVHNRQELEGHYHPEIDLLGVNSRDLQTFSVSLESTLKMAEFLPNGVVAVAESGIEQPRDIRQLRQAGYQGFLIGTRFMRRENPDQACKEFIDQVHLKNAL